MILVSKNTPHSILETLARHLSPACSYTQTPNSSPPRWQFAESGWAATAIYNVEPPHNMIGISLDCDSFSDDDVNTIELSVAKLCGLDSKSEACIFLNERNWDKCECEDREWDSGYETLYRLREDTLRITVRNLYDAAREPRAFQSTAISEVCAKGTMKWKLVCQLYGNLMSSRREHYTEANAKRFHADEGELLRLTRTILKS